MLSLSPSPSQSARSEHPVFSFTSSMVSPSSSISRTVPAALTVGVGIGATSAAIGAVSPTSS